MHLKNNALDPNQVSSARRYIVAQLFSGLVT
jgi:hypothetical protein